MFKVRVDSTDIEFDCAEGQSILEAAKAAGFELPYSCRNGICGSCKGVIQEGTYSSRSDAGGVLTKRELAEGSALFCEATPTSDVRVKVGSIKKFDPNASKNIKAKLYRLERVTDDVSVLSLRFPAGVRAKFKAGQYLQVKLHNGECRSYSMANPSHQTDAVQLHVRHVAGGKFSDYLENEAAEGDHLDVELPLGAFYLRTFKNPLLFVVSGTGFAPVKAIIESLIREGFPQTPIYLYWGGRKRSDLYMSDLAQKWAAKYSNFKYVPVYSEEFEETDRSGFVHKAVLDDFPTLKGIDVYACGVPAMVTAARQDFVNLRQLPNENFYCDAFVYSSGR